MAGSKLVVCLQSKFKALEAGKLTLQSLSGLTTPPRSHWCKSQSPKVEEPVVSLISKSRREKGILLLKGEKTASRESKSSFFSPFLPADWIVSVHIEDGSSSPRPLTPMSVSSGNILKCTQRQCFTSHLGISWHN